jgi:hypothetical protein
MVGNSKVKVKFAPEQAMKDQRRSSDIAVLFNLRAVCFTAGRKELLSIV